MRTIIKWSEEDIEKVRSWKIKKCGYDSFGMLFLKFSKEMKKRDDQI